MTLAMHRMRMGVPNRGSTRDPPALVSDEPNGFTIGDIESRLLLRGQPGSRRLPTSIFIDITTSLAEPAGIRGRQRMSPSTHVVRGRSGS